MPAPTLPREIKLGAKGRDVRAYQRALRKAGFRPKGTKTTNEFDAQMDGEVRAFQQAKSLLVDGEIGENTFGQLLPFIDAWGKRLLAAVKKAVPSSIRQKVVASAFVGYNNRDSIRYTQTGQRMQGVREAHPPTQASRSSRTARRSRPGAIGRPAARIRTVSTTTARAGPGRKSSTASSAPARDPAISSSTGRATRRSTTSLSTSGTAMWSATARKPGLRSIRWTTAAAPGEAGSR